MYCVLIVHASHSYHLSAFVFDTICLAFFFVCLYFFLYFYYIILKYMIKFRLNRFRKSAQTGVRVYGRQTER